MVMRSLLAGLAAVGALLPLAATAHHGWSGYDAAKLVTLSGTVAQASFTFPHAMLTLDAAGKAWHVVLAPPSRMERRGLAAGSIQPGMEVTVEGYPHRTDPVEFRAERIQVNGRSFELR
jgi:hypothetical protein